MDRHTPRDTVPGDGLPLSNHTAITAPPRRVYLWTDVLPCPEADATNLIGNKAASLRMLRRAGLSVPPAFTLTIAACQQYFAAGRTWPEGLWEEVRSALTELETVTGRKIGRGPRPLTLAVRSGGAESMPGLMATVLHCGLTDALVREIDDDATWTAFAEFLDGYAPIRGQDRLQKVPSQSNVHGPRERCRYWLEQLAAMSGGPLPNDPESIVRDVISAVFDSWENPAARRFRELHGWRAIEGTSVTVQAMFDSALSGVVFSRDPQKSLEHIVVEVTAGLGRRLVAGQVTPVRWSIDRNTLAILPPALDGNKAGTIGDNCSTVPVDVSGTALAAGEAGLPNDRWLAPFRSHIPGPESIAEFVQRGLQPLCKAALATESTLETPVDMEFGYSAGELVFFQARTIKDASANLEEVRRAERERLLRFKNQGRRLWVQHNLSDTLPAPTPLTWSLWQDFMTGAGGFGHLHQLLGYRPARNVRHDGFLTLIAGRIYADPVRLTQMYCAGFPLGYDKAALQRDPAVLNSAPNQLDLLQLDPWFLLRWPLIAWTMIRSQYCQRRLARRAAVRFEHDLQPRIRAWVEQERQIQLHDLPLRDLLTVFERRRRDLFHRFAVETLLPGTLGGAMWSSVQRQLNSVLGDNEGCTLANQILATVPNPIMDRQRALLQQVAADKSAMDSFLREFGHRGPNEMDLSALRWREIPEFANAAAHLAMHRAGPAKAGANLDRDLQAALQSAGAGCLNRELSEDLRQAIALLQFREVGKHEFLLVYDYLRAVVKEIGERTGLSDGVHYLSAAELHELPENRDYREKVAQRRRQYRACRKLFIPAVIEIDDELTDFGFPPRPETRGRSLHVNPLCGGQANGRVFLLRDKDHFVVLPQDSVVVASSLDSGWLPFLTNAAAIVVEQGGTLSHIALLARAMEIPTVVCDQITKIAIEDEHVSVDADNGILEFRDRNV